MPASRRAIVQQVAQNIQAAPKVLQPFCPLGATCDFSTSGNSSRACESWRRPTDAVVRNVGLATLVGSTSSRASCCASSAFLRLVMSRRTARHHPAAPAKRARALAGQVVAGR